jgi:hypothetical protein
LNFLKDKYGKASVVANYGAIDSAKRTIASEGDFKTDPECKFFVGNPTTGGFGLNFNCSY